MLTNQPTQIQFSELFKYKLNRHDDIHILVGEQLVDIIDYSPETFQTLFLHTMKNINSSKLYNICMSLPFEDDINIKIYNLEIEAEKKYSIVNRDVLPLGNSIIQAPPYFTREEIFQLFAHHSIKFRGTINFNGSIENKAKPFDAFAFEKYYFGNTVGEIRFLRELAANGGKEKTEDEKFFYNLGASVIAPVYALYTEWIIKFCNKNNIKILLPLMREATVLSTCIRKLTKIQCEPIFCSRRFLFNASINSNNFIYKMEQILIKSKATPSVLCKDIGLNGSEFSQFQTMRDLKNANYLEQFSQFLYSNKYKITSYSEHQRNLFCQNLHKIIANKSNQKMATVDIGFSGTSESLIDDILKMQRCMLNISHLIVMGSDTAQIRNIQNGLHIYSWLGMAGENTHFTKRLMYQIQTLEPLINDICGTTLAYDSNSPILDSIVPAGLEENFPRALACQRGIYAFIDLWSQYREFFDVNKLLKNKIGFINIWRRLIETPNVEEAQHIGTLKLYDNYTIKKTVYTVLGESNTQIVNCNTFLKNKNHTNSDYPQAKVVIQNPNFFKRELIEKHLNIPSSKSMVDIIEKLGNKKVAIFAAGQRGKDFLKVAKLFNINISYFVDSDKNLQGKYIDGVPVVSLSTAKDVDVFVNASYNYPEEISQIIINYYNKDKTIYTID